MCGDVRKAQYYHKLNILILKYVIFVFYNISELSEYKIFWKYQTNSL